MSKITLNDVVNLQNETTAVTNINTNKSRIVTAFENTLSRDGTAPNQMGANLDMNSHAILNVSGPPFAGHDVANKAYVDQEVTRVGRQIADITSAINDLDIGGSVTPVDSSVIYTQSDIGAIPRPLIKRLNNTLWASEFAGDPVAGVDKSVGLQYWLDAVVASGKEGRLDPGHWFLSSGLVTHIPSTTANVSIFGEGAVVKTDPSQTIGAFQFNGPLTAVYRYQETRRLLLQGMSFDCQENTRCKWGIRILGYPRTQISGVTFGAGTESTNFNDVNFSGIIIEQSDPLNNDTAAFWTEVDHCNFRGAGVKAPAWITSYGYNNALSITKNRFDGAVNAIIIYPATDTSIPNGSRILDNDFEAVDFGIRIQPGGSGPDGLVVAYNRVEAMGQAFYAQLNSVGGELPPIIGPNYVTAAVTTGNNYIFNPNNLRIDVRDRFFGTSTLNAASVAPGATAVLPTIPIPLASVGDIAEVSMNGDLQGLVLTGYTVSNGVVPRLSNPTSTAKDLPSALYSAYVRKVYNV